MTNTALAPYVAKVDPTKKREKKRHGYITLCVEPEIKDIYNTLQDSTGRDMGKELKALVADFLRAVASKR